MRYISKHKPWIILHLIFINMATQKLFLTRV
ncbi:hypothetical protein SKA58_16818 [Sphingomonas sp. SKA58]|nr:hypothetical protein SKA58_16818 [Sphingomonas sp. SKA58]